jgi:hypothetical protein
VLVRCPAMPAIEDGSSEEVGNKKAPTEPRRAEMPKWVLRPNQKFFEPS